MRYGRGSPGWWQWVELPKSGGAGIGCGMERLLGVCVLMLICAGAERGQDKVVGGAGESGGTVVATGQLIRPAGKAVEYHARVVDLALSADGKTLFVKDNSALVSIDVATWT